MNVAETRKQLEKRMDEAARKYAETHDEKYKEEPLELAHKLTDGRAHRVKDYEAIARHVLKTRVGQQAFGKLALGLLNVSQLQTLQTKLKSKGLKANSVNGIIHSCLRAMLRDARVDGLIKTNLYDRDFFPALPLTDTKKSINPYKPEERGNDPRGFPGPSGRTITVLFSSNSGRAAAPAKR